MELLGATAIHDLLASEQVIWSFLRRVGVRIELPGVTVESIPTGENASVKCILVTGSYLECLTGCGV
jgi:hypothetical protein